MRPYIEDLIKEIKSAVEEAKQYRKQEQSPQKELANIGSSDDRRKYLYGNPMTLESITGIPLDALPPYYLISENHRNQLGQVMEELLEAWGFTPDFPDKLPYSQRYRFLRNIWGTQQVYIGSGPSYIDFCDFDQQTCPFPNHCDMCDKIKEQEELYNRLINNIKK